MRTLILALAMAGLGCSAKLEHQQANRDVPNVPDLVTCDSNPLQNGTLITCTNGQSLALIGVDAFHVAATFDLCGADPGFNETVLKLSDGNFALHFKSGGLEYIQIHTAGTYTSTDGHGCIHTLDSNGVVVDHDGNVFQ